MKKILVLISLSIFIFSTFGGNYIFAAERTKAAIVKDIILKKRELDKSSPKGKLYVQALDAYFEKYENNNDAIVSLLEKISGVKQKLGSSKKEQEIKLLVEYIEYKGELFLGNFTSIIENNEEINDFLKLNKEDSREFIKSESIEELYETAIQLYGVENPSNILSNSELLDLYILYQKEYIPYDFLNKTNTEYKNDLLTLFFEGEAVENINRRQLLELLLLTIYNAEYNGLYELNKNNIKVNNDIRQITIEIQKIIDVGTTNYKDTILEGTLEIQDMLQGKIYSGSPNFDILGLNPNDFKSPWDIQYKIAYTEKDNYLGFQAKGLQKTENNKWKTVIKGSHAQWDDSYLPSLFIDSKTGEYLQSGDLINN